jgi:NAD-dependent deacetylase
MLDTAAEMAEKADIFLIVGTSLQVYPAAGLMRYARRNIPVYYIDPNPAANFELNSMPNLKIIEAPASTGVQMVIDLIKG